MGTSILTSRPSKTAAFPAQSRPVVRESAHYQECNERTASTQDPHLRHRLAPPPAHHPRPHPTAHRQRRQQQDARRHSIHQLYGNSLTFQPPPELDNTDLCFIDAGHSLPCIQADTETALKILSPHGVIVWDDYTWFTGGVSQYLTTLSKSLSLHRIAGSQLVLYRRTASPPG